MRRFKELSDEEKVYRCIKYYAKNHSGDRKECKKLISKLRTHFRLHPL